ncbi:MAG: hypothetical protein QNJ16_15025 [Rhodobacter sp.]|nr:hypothetical protein [Rhodobacter sp.]
MEGITTQSVDSKRTQRRVNHPVAVGFGWIEAPNPATSVRSVLKGCLRQKKNNKLEKMSTLNSLRTARVCINALESHGLELGELSDFDVVEQLIEDISKPYLTPILAPNRNDFTQENAFWLVAWDDCEPAMIIGAKLEDLKDEPIDKFWIRTARRHYPTPAGETIKSVAPHIPNELGGRLVYIGDLFVRPKNRGTLGVLEKFMLLAHLTVAIRWNPDFTYAFMRDRDVRLGFANRYGFTKHVPFARVWSDPPHGRSNSEWLVSLSRSDREHLTLNFARSTDMLRVVENESVPARVVNG